MGEIKDTGLNIRNSNVGKNWSDSNELSTEWFKTENLDRMELTEDIQKMKFKWKRNGKKTVNAVLTECNFHG